MIPEDPSDDAPNTFWPSTSPFGTDATSPVYQAFALVKTPDYTYRNPIPGTRSATERESRVLAEAYARRTFVAPRYPAWRAERFLREVEIGPAPRPANRPKPP